MWACSSQLNRARWACTTGSTPTRLSGRVPLFLTRIRSQENSWGRKLMQWFWWEPPHESPEKNELVSLSAKRGTRRWEPWSDVGSQTRGLLKLVTTASGGESTLQIPTACQRNSACTGLLRSHLTPAHGLLYRSLCVPTEFLSFTVIKLKTLGNIFLVSISISRCFAGWFTATSPIHLIRFVSTNKTGLWMTTCLCF